MLPACLFQNDILIITCYIQIVDAERKQKILVDIAQKEQGQKQRLVSLNITILMILSNCVA